MASIDQLPPSYAPMRAKHGRYNRPSANGATAQTIRLTSPTSKPVSKPTPKPASESEPKAPDLQRIIARWKRTIRHYVAWSVFWLFATCICIGLTLAIHYRIFGNVIYECVALLMFCVTLIGIIYTGPHLYGALQKLDNAEWRYSREQELLDE